MARVGDGVYLSPLMRLRVNGKRGAVSLECSIGQVDFRGNQDSHNRAQQHKQQECRERSGFE
jgi:hypothetical protein